MKRVLFRTKRIIACMKHRYFDPYVFVHINKTGGSSIETALRIPLDHRTALERIAELGPEAWRRKFSFTVVRNPWDKVVSHYHYRVKTNQTGLGDGSLGFNEWVKRTYGNQDAYYYDYPKMFMPQTKWITDADGNIAVDEIVRFENLETEFNEVLKKLGKKATLPHLKSSDHGDYRQYYDDEAIGIVADWFKDDLEHFGYRF